MKSVTSRLFSQSRVFKAACSVQPHVMDARGRLLSVAEFSTAIGKSPRSAGSTIKRTVSFRFLAFIYDPSALQFHRSLSQTITIYPSAIYYLIQLQDIRSIYCYYNGSTHLNYVNPRIHLYNTYLSFTRIIQLFSFCMT